MATTAIEQLIETFESLNADLTPLDRVYVKNRLFALIGDDADHLVGQNDALDNLDLLVDHAVSTGHCQDSVSARQILEADIMALGTPLPSTVNREFWSYYSDSPEAATDYFYQLSRANNYIQTRAIKKNVAFTTETEYGDLEITINLSKPEKDPRDIAAAAKNKRATNYPACQLCVENEGYEGRADYPARANHRIVRFTLGGKTWGMQYSPYAYFSEHTIFLDAVHEPMAMGRSTFTELIDIIDWLPHYFVGSNAEIPLVGGSMLSHEHFQGGRHVFAMEKAPIEKQIELNDFPTVSCGRVKWPMSVLRLTAKDRTELIDAAVKVLNKWREFSDPSVSTLAKSPDAYHHTVTPIARRIGEDYQLDLVLRDNQTSAEFPDGIFHPHPDVQHIKRENIGLIEVMGLAVLPARLLPELAEVKKFLLDQPNEIAESHLPWAKELKKNHDWTTENADAQLNDAVGHVFARVLEDAGVFKRTEEGFAAFDRFINTL